MKSSKTPEKRKCDTMSHLPARDIKFNARTFCISALIATTSAVECCVLAGQALNDWKNGDEHGAFLEKASAAVPEVSVRTMQRWMSAARNLLAALPTIDEAAEGRAISEILTGKEEGLSMAAKEWRTLWYEFLQGKTIKECIAGVVVDGDESHRIARAINGATHGGAGGDRKDFPLFVARKFRDSGSHLSHWEGMSEAQRLTIQQATRAAILGEAIKVGAQVFNYKPWPEEMCKVAIEALRERLKK